MGRSSDVPEKPTCSPSAPPAAPTASMPPGPDPPEDLQRQVTRLRNSDAHRFRTMCHMHLSFMLDLDGASFEDFLSEDTTDGVKVKKSNFPHFGRKKSKGDRNEMMATQLRSVENIEELIRYLSRPENINQEGLFRKSGQLSRQRVLRDKLICGDSLEMELLSGQYTAHDCANLLKGFLGELSEPLLTEKHFSIYCKIPDMVGRHVADKDRPLLEQRQMATAQLLVQLLPRDNATLLRALLVLLHQVATTEGNLMTAETLGTMFAPHLLVPRRMSASSLQQVTTNTTRAVAFLIENAPEIFKIPEALMRDITAYWQEMEEATESRQHQEDDLDPATCHHRYRKNQDDEALHTTVTFVNRQAMQQASQHTDTQVELAHLYAHINSMPESAKKRKLLKQFNRANGMGTPMTAAGKHKRSRSLSESIKKMVGRSNHKRRGSGHAAQVHAADLATRSAVPRSDPPVVQHTPIIKSLREHNPSSAAAGAAPGSPALASPVVRLFRDVDQPILPSSPSVHIVDLKPQPPLLCRSRKRKLYSPPRTPHSSAAGRPPRPLSTACRTPSTPINLHHLHQQHQLHHQQQHPQKQQHQQLRRLAANNENAPPLGVGRWTARSSKSPHAPVVVTPDGRFEKASSFVSPISQSVNKAPVQIKVNNATSAVLHQFCEFDV